MAPHMEPFALVFDLQTNNVEFKARRIEISNEPKGSSSRPWAFYEPGTRVIMTATK